MFLDNSLSELASSFGSESAGNAEPGSGLPRQQSLLFPSLFSKLNLNRKLNVLDVGPGCPETIKFFSPFHCRLHFSSLYAEPLVREGIGDLDRKELTRQFTKLLAIPKGTRFDLCLLWDFPHYLEDDALCAFSDALEPYLHERTIGHGFAVRTTDTRLNNRWYGIDQPHLFTMRKPWAPQGKFHPHSQALLINLLTCFNIDRGMLLPDGRLEVIMKSTL